MGDAPDFKGDGIAVWIKKDKEGNKYLSVSLFGKINIAAFKYEPKKQDNKDEDII